MSNREALYTALRNADKAGDTAAAQKLAAYIQSLPAEASEQTLKLRETVADREARGTEPRANAPQPTFLGGVGRDIKNAGAGAVRGAGSIGATLLTPLDYAAHKATGGGEFAGFGRTDRRESMDNALKNLVGADTESLAYGVGKVGAEVAGTAGVGGGLVKGANALRNASKFVPALSPAVQTALQTAGIGTQAATLPVRAGAGAAVGAVSAGLVDPSAQNVGVGGLIGGALPAVGPALKAAGAKGQTLLDEFGRPTAAGRTQAATRKLQSAGVTPQVARNLTNAPTVTGARPMLADQIPLSDPATAQRVAAIQDALQTANPEAAAQFTERVGANNAARIRTLEELAGEGGGREFAAANRSGTAGSMYDDAFAVAADARKLTPEQSRTMQTLQRAPAIKEAMAAARANASNAGKNVGSANTSGSVEGLHNVKLALDAKITQARNPTNPAGQATLDGLEAAQKRLVGFIESISPEYANARGVYAQMSTPINQMDVAQQLLDTASLPDLSGVRRLTAGQYTKALGRDNALVKSATGRDLGSLERVMEPAQLNKLQAIADELGRSSAVGTAAIGPGSSTARRMMTGRAGMLRNTNESPVNVKNLLSLAASPFTAGTSVAVPVAEVLGNRFTRETQQEVARLMLNPGDLRTLLNAPANTLSANQLKLREAAKEVLRRVPATTTQGDE